ncbi:MAG TPA: GntR family transcriptional regulator [Candidatus Dormibacteraeota bacterium]
MVYPAQPAASVIATSSSSHRPLRELVAEDIRSLILSQQLPPGTRLIEADLAVQFGVSRIPVREAIRLLEATGLVEVVPRKGAHVTVVDGADIKHIQELRIAIEGFIAEVAALRHTPWDIEQLTLAVDTGLAASESGDAVGAAVYHRDFHLAMEHAAKNPYLALVVNPLRQRTEMVFSVLLERQGSVAWEQHRRLRDAIAAGDPMLARREMESHIKDAMSHW